MPLQRATVHVVEQCPASHAPQRSLFA